MNRLIAVINKLQDAFTVLGEEPLSLPQIAVVGGQSAGKSSVLENIVGRDFLPRGSGIVTRRPLVLKLVNDPNLKEEWAEFLHKKGQRFTAWADVRAEISQATENDPACQNKSISDRPINLTIHSADVLDLTLVDLPGLTRVAVGDQPKDINEQIRKLLLKYIRKQNTIILAVSPANQDLANSDAIQLSKEVDPDGYRTVGVLTKLDLMDKGTNAMDILNNQVIPLRLGYIPVVNRGQHAIDNDVPIEKQWAEEEKYFADHPAYRSIQERCGTRHLTFSLNKTLVGHIKATLPEISGKIAVFLSQKKKELQEYAALPDPATRSAALLNTVVGYAQKFKSRMEGTDDEADIDTFCGGAKIKSLFKGKFRKSISDVDVLEKLSPAQIRNIISNSGGLKGGLFIPDEAFHVVIRQAVRELRGPANECVQVVYDELLNQALSVSTDSLERYDVLRNELRSNVRAVINKRMEETQALVNTLIDMEIAHINTDHPDFLKDMTVWDLMNAAVYVENQNNGGEASKPNAPAASHSASRPPAGSFGGGARGTMAPPPSLIEGWLEIKYEHRSSFALKQLPGFTKRWCVLAQRSIVHSKTEFGEDSVAVELDGATVQRNTGANDMTVHITPAVGKPFVLKCVDVQEATKWIHSVQIAASQETWDSYVQGKIKQQQEKTAPSLPKASALKQINRPGRTASMTDTDVVQTRVIEALLKAYFEIIRVKVLDSIPKAVTLKLVNSVSTSLHTELVQSLYDPSRVDELLSESPEIAKRRENLMKMIASMEEAKVAIQEVKTDAESLA
jgi:GTP-binding protein EngB required for normal cell division